MNPNPLQHDPDSLDGLVAGLIDRAADDAQRRRLIEKLQADPAARQEYVELIQLSTMLEWVHLEVETRPLPVLEKAPPRFRWAAVAALVAIATLALVLILRGAEPLATITALDGARWRAAQPPNVGAALPAGSFELTAGRAELTTARGVTIALQGPATFELKDAGTVHLEFGRARLHVPPAGVGFTITTPTARCIDLGTDFELTVREHGQTDVHVLEGRVQVASRHAAGESAPIILNSGGVAKIDHRGVARLGDAPAPAPQISPVDLMAGEPWYLRDASVTIHETGPAGKPTLQFSPGGIGIAEKVLDVTGRRGQPLVVTAGAMHAASDPLSPQQHLQLRVRFFDGGNRELPGRVDAPVIESSDEVGKMRTVKHHVIVPDGAVTIRVALIYRDAGLSTGRIQQGQAAVHLERD